MLAGALLAVIIIHRPILISGFRRTQADLLDSRFNNNLLEHSYEWITGHAALWNPTFCYPAPNLLACSDLMLSFAPPYWAARLIGCAPDTAFQLWMIGATALNFLGAYALLRVGLRFSRWPAWASALMFACAGSRVIQLGHQQLYCQAYVLLALYALLRFAAKRRFGWAVLAGVAVALQFWGGFYMGLFLALTITLGMVWVIVIKRREHRPLSPRTALKLSLASVAFLLLILPPAVHYLAVAREAKSPDIDAINAMLPTVKAWLYCGDSSILYGRFDRFYEDLSVPAEQAIGFGIATTVISFIGLWSARRRPLILVTLLTSASLVLLATRFGESLSLWWIVRRIVPGASAIRAVSRIGLLLAIPVTLGLAIVLERLRGQHRTFIATLVAVVCLAEQLHHAPAYDKLQMRTQVSRITNVIPANTQAFFFTGSDPVRWADDQVDAMTASMDSHTPTVNGYTGTWPKSIRPLIMANTPGNEANVEGQLADWIASHQLDPAKVAWLVETPTGVNRRPIRDSHPMLIQATRGN